MKILLVQCFAILVRYMVSLWPFSGQGDEPLHGDYEAQRHWMEITLGVPLSLWYRFDLEYWGLDYPPLTAYVSWLCGQLSEVVEPESMVLGLSRGYETLSHKVFMRSTVLALDFMIFFPAAFSLASRLSSSRDATIPRRARPPSEALMMAAMQPSLILIDHGHFQYNSVCLGLAMGGTAAIVGGGNKGEILGSVLFCLSLNFKQMALYYAPAFFFYLLASCLWGSDGSGSGGRESGCGASALTLRWVACAARRVFLLGAVVILTFGFLWWPFCVYDGGYGCFSSLTQVLVRLFPFSRGLFEDKVANIWFCIDVVFKLRRKLTVPILAKVALLSTISLLVPVGIELLRPGRRLTGRRLVLSMFNASLAFFLCSFQVHEKSLLLPLCPLAFLWEASPLFVTWLQVVGAFSMRPLLAREGLLIPCVACTVLYVVLSAVLAKSLPRVADGKEPRNETCLLFGRLVTQGRLCALVAVSLAGMVLLTVLEGVLTPPESLPHLHPTLNAIFSCCNLVVAYVLGIIWQWREGDAEKVPLAVEDRSEGKKHR